MNKHSARPIAAALAALCMALGAGQSQAHGNAAHDKTNDDAPISSEEHAYGRQGDPKQPARTIRIDMSDTMRFHPADITVKEGDTVRFVVTNKGRLMHEMVIGTMEELKAHGAQMKKHPGMQHDAPNMAHAAPGKAEEMVWQFTRAGEFYYACLIPGHFEAGMVGKIKVTKG